MANEMIALAARCKAATGPDRELDFDIHALSEPEYASVDAGAKRFLVQYASYPAYTASIDAALTLVPEGWAFEVGNKFDGTGEAGLFPQGNAFDGRIKVNAATPALALAAACLRARASQQGEVE